MPGWAWVHRELRRPNVTLALLWEEYRAGAPDGFGYSRLGASNFTCAEAVWSQAAGLGSPRMSVPSPIWRRPP
jgi:transposase